MWSCALSNCSWVIPGSLMRRPTAIADPLSNRRARPRHLKSRTPRHVTHPRALALRVGPGIAGADVDGERRVERIRRAHLLAHELLHDRRLGVGCLEQELVSH